MKRPSIEKSVDFVTALVIPESQVGGIPFAQSEVFRPEPLAAINGFLSANVGDYLAKPSKQIAHKKRESLRVGSGYGYAEKFIFNAS
jgi:hypothetical protein